MPKYIPICFLLCLSIMSNGFAQSADTLSQTDSLDAVHFEKNIFDYLKRDSVLHVQIETDFEQFVTDKSIDAYQPALFRFRNPKGELCSLPTEIKARGKSRRQFCNFPPFKMKFFREHLEEHQLDKINSLKVVTHCRKEIDIRKIVLKEYLVYKMLNLFTENSMEVQLLKIDYLDAGRKKAPVVQYGMLLENEKSLAKRLGGKVMKQRGALSEYVPEEDLIFMALFQYLIGNTDWVVDQQHNVKFIKCPKEKKFRIVPYDFDVCGMVNAVYATPAAHLPILEVQERLYLGQCVEKESFEKGLVILRERKEKLFTLIQEFDLLTNRQRKKMMRFLETFYEAIEEADFIERELLEKCKG